MLTIFMYLMLLSKTWRFGAVFFFFWWHLRSRGSNLWAVWFPVSQAMVQRVWTMAGNVTSINRWICLQFSNGARGFFFCDVSVDFWSSERNFRSRELGCVRFSNMFLRLTVNDDCVHDEVLDLISEELCPNFIVIG